MTDIYQKAYTSIYPSRLGDILLAADEIGLTGLWFSGRAILQIHFRQSRLRRKRRYLHRQGNGWTNIFGKRTGLYTEAASDRIAVSAGGMEDFAADSLWSDDDLRRNRKPDGKAAEPASYVCAGGRRCGGT